VIATLALMPNQVGDAGPSSAGQSVVSGHGHVGQAGSSHRTALPVRPKENVPAQPKAVDPAPSPTGTTPPGSSDMPAVPSAPGQPSATHGIVPPQNPPANIPPDPNFLNSCSGTQYDDSNACVTATLDAIARGRQAEGLAAMILPGNWQSLSPQEQLFVATDLERTARGLPPIEGMASVLEQAAAAAAAADADPLPPEGFGVVAWAGNWAGAVGNPLEAIYYWMYDDGPGSANIDCSATDSAGCWGHRDNVLVEISCAYCVMGTAYAPNAYRGTASWSELIVEATGPTPMDFTWQQEEQQ
jgi:hypothetical protein